MAGRPTKCTPELTDLVCAELEEGIPLEPAANSLGVADSTLYLWLDKGLQDVAPYSAFLDAVTRAKASGELKLLKRVMAGDEMGGSFGKAKAAAWVLEKTRRNQYGAQKNLREQDAVREVLEVVRGICAPADFARIIARLEALDRAGSEGVPAGVAGDDPDTAVH